jgi:hypothetical protein
MSALPPKADMCGALAYVCFGPKADIHRLHSITSSAAKRMPFGMVTPRALAVLRLNTGLLDWQFGWFRAFQNSCHVVRDSTPQRWKVDAIGHQPTINDVMLEGEHGRQLMLNRQLCKLSFMLGES